MERPVQLQDVIAWISIYLQVQELEAGFWAIQGLEGSSPEDPRVADIYWPVSLQVC